MIAVVGAGVVGCATAVALKKRGHDVTIYEKRPDPRKDSEADAGRSINLAISSRGLRALQLLDPALCEVINKNIVPMNGRMVHPQRGDAFSVQYGLTSHEAINSVGRALLNNLLLQAAEKCGVTIKFGHTAPLTKAGLRELAPVVFGCDGARSRVREIVLRDTDSKLEVENVGTYYVEIPIDAKRSKDWARDKLHIWPRGSHMLIALPNRNGTFTGTLFAPHEAVTSQMRTAAQFAAWFATEFPDAAIVVGSKSLEDVALHAPLGRLSSVKCQPYNLGGEILLLGDAAHSMVPFYGQGLNCGLEDVRILFEEFIDVKYPDPKMWSDAFEAYSAYRKPDCDAISNLSMENYQEMRADIATSGFKLRKSLDNALARVFGDYWQPLYTMVSFRDDIRYSAALAASRWQQNCLDQVMGTVSSIAAVAVAVAACNYFGKRS